MCAWLWATVGFLVEDQCYRSVFDLYNNNQVVKKLSDPREDEIDDALMPPGCMSPVRMAHIPLANDSIVSAEHHA
jgi:hypothetical protein